MPRDDGVVTVPVESSQSEENEMALDISENVGSLLISESAANIQSDNREGRATTTLASGVLKGAMSRNFDELGVAESRSVSGVMATPVASPATQQ